MLPLVFVKYLKIVMIPFMALSHTSTQIHTNVNMIKDTEIWYLLHHTNSCKNVWCITNTRVWCTGAINRTRCCDVALQHDEDIDH